MGKPRNQMIDVALKHYISGQSERLTGIQQAQKTLAKGAGKDFEAVVDELRTKIQHKQ